MRPTYSPLSDSHWLLGGRALGAAGASPQPGRGPRHPDNPALSSLYVTGLGLTGPVGPLQPCLGSRSCVDSHGKAGDQNSLEVGLFLRLPASARPSIRSSIPAFLCSAMAVSHFLFSSRLWRHRGLPGVGEVLRPPERQTYFSFTSHPHLTLIFP